MRYSSVNHWYRIQEVLDTLRGTPSTEVETHLLRHLSASHLVSMEIEGNTLNIECREGERLIWSFDSQAAAESFRRVICEWTKAVKVAVPACA